MQGHEKLANTILYLLRACGLFRPGVTGLLKLLYFADYEHYRRHLATITEEQYVALERGPVINDYKAIFAQFVDDGLLEPFEVAVRGHSTKKREYRTQYEPDDAMFTESERETLDAVIRKYGRETGRNLSDKTHLEGPWCFVWDSARPGRVIPTMAFRWLDNLPDDHDLEAAMIALKPLERQIQELNS